NYFWGRNPHDAPALYLESSWELVSGRLIAQFLSQIGAAHIFDENIQYNVLTGELTGNFLLLESAIDDLETIASGPSVDAESFWKMVASYLEFTVGLDNLLG